MIRGLLASIPKKGALRVASAALAISWCVGCVGGSRGVTRMSDGVRYPGRFINPEAYAAYLLGVESEARGEFDKALSAYLEAHAEDPDSPEIWVRIGAVRCFSSEPSAGPAAARASFERGLELDPAYYGTYAERARCAERAGNFTSALSDATAAVARRPQDEPANLLVARILSALGKRVEARAWLEAYQSYYPATIATQRALEAARGTSPEPAGVTAGKTEAPSAARSDAFAELRSGRTERARRQAQIELEADPTNTDAWIATLVACDALHDDPCFDSTISRLQTPSLSPSSTALGYLRELLARRAGVPVTF